MRHGSRRAKGRRLQVEVAVILAKKFKLQIEATPPTKPGIREGAIWVAEDDKPDLRVRTMGQPGADVAILSLRAKRKISMYNSQTLKYDPVWFEVKNVEAWRLDAKFWEKGQLPSVMVSAVKQAKKNAPEGWRPIAVIGKNYMPPLAVWKDPEKYDLDELPDGNVPMLTTDDWVVIPFRHFVKMLG